MYVKIKRIDDDRFKIEFHDALGGQIVYLNKSEIELLIREALKSLSPMGFELKDNKDNKDVLNGR